MDPSTRTFEPTYPTDAAACVFCGVPAGRPIRGKNWLCRGCERWQFVGECPRCGHQVGRGQWEARGNAWPPAKEG